MRRATGIRSDGVARLMVGGMTLVLGVMFCRVVQLQLAPSSKLVEHMHSRVAKRTVPAPRGDLVDRRYRPLASTQFGWQVFVDPTEFPSPPDEAIARLSDALAVSPEEIGVSIISAMARNKAILAEARAPQAREAEVGLFKLLGVSMSAVPAAASMAETEPDDPDSAKPRKLARYVRVSGVLADDTLAAVKALKCPGVHFEQRGVRDYPSGSVAASIIGKVDYKHDGLLGAEHAFDKSLVGTGGRVLYVRDAGGRPLWIGPGAYDQPRRGEDVRLAIDLEIQRLATEELQRGVFEFDAAGGRCIVFDPATGEILAMVDIIREVPDARPFPWPAATPAVKGRPGLLYEPPQAVPRARYITIKPDPARKVHPAMGRNRCVEDVYEPGSTFKPFIWASITELGLARPNDVFNTYNGFFRTSYGRAIHDVHHHPQLTWENVLVESSNIGMAQGIDRMSFDQAFHAIRKLGFGSKSGIELPYETAGLVTPRKDWRKYTQTSVSFGQEIAVTPVQMVRAFAVFARTGELAGTLPPVKIAAADANDVEAGVLHRVIRPDVALMVREILRKVAAQMESKMALNADHKESGWRYSIFGKSGTAQIPLGKAPAGKRRPRGQGFFEKQYNASFIAAGPIEDPKLVVLVVIDDPGPELVRKNVYYGALTAGPVVRRVMERSLSYLGVPPSAPASLSVDAGSGAIAD